MLFNPIGAMKFLYRFHHCGVIIGYNQQVTNKITPLDEKSIQPTQNIFPAS